MTRGVNYGIQGANVHVRADALAIGDRARAVSTRSASSNPRELREAVDRLQAAVDTLPLPAEARTAIAGEVTRLSEVVDTPQVEPERVGSSLAGIAATLSSAGVVATQVASLVEPVSKIAALVRLSMHGLGW